MGAAYPLGGGHRSLARVLPRARQSILGRHLTVPFLDLSRHVAALRDELERAVTSTLDGGRFVGGSAVEAFESAFAAYCGATRCVGVGSGTDAITIALQAVGVGPGDEVVTAANTCVPTVAGIERAGATAVLVDADSATHTIDPAAIDEVITDRTKAVVPVHLYGQCADMDAINAIARRHGLRVVEDAAQAHGAEYRGRRTGTLGDAAAFSFYPTKNLGALGDAGAVVTNDPDVGEQARLLRSYGERTRYDSVLRGMNSRLDTLHAAVLGAKLPHLEGWNERRRELASAYAEALAGLPLGLPVEASNRRHVYHLFVVTVEDRDAFRERLTGKGIETLVHYPRAVHQHPAYADAPRFPRGLHVAERLAAAVVSLPLFPELTDVEVGRVASAVTAALRDHRT